MLRMIEEAYKVVRLGGSDFSAFDGWNRATLVGAEALSLDKHIGNFAKGKEADFVVLNASGNRLLAKRLSAAKALSERMFALAMMGGEGIVQATYVMGKRVRMPSMTRSRSKPDS